MNEDKNKNSKFDNFVMWFGKYKLFKPFVDLFFKYHEIAMYLIFGVLTTLVDYAVYFPLTNLLKLNHLIAFALAWAVAVVFAFVTNKLWVFGSTSFNKKIVLREFPAFAGGRVFSLILSEVIMYVMVDIMTVNQNISKIVISILVIIINYILSKLFVFKKRIK